MNLTPEKLAARLAVRNPFATRAVRPGAIPYRFTDGDSSDRLVSNLREHDWCGEIIGPHGSGKSTLLQTLIPVFRDVGREVQLFTLRSGESKLKVATNDMRGWGRNWQIIIDGYEQLGGWTRTLIQRIRQRQGFGLLIASHEPTGSAVILRTAPSLEMVQNLVNVIQSQELRVFDHDVQLSFHKHAGNVREVFFELYDLYEQRHG